MIRTNSSCPKTVEQFIRKLEKEIEAVFFRYSDATRDFYKMEPAFWYGEQQTKTFITLALGKLCAGAVMQEPVLNRKKKGGKKSEGRADYYCKFRKQQFFIELKQIWLKNVKPNKLALGNILTAHRKVVDQISEVSTSWYDIGYSIGLTIVPIAYDISTKTKINPVNLELQNNLLEFFISKKSIVHTASYFSTTPSGTMTVEWTSSNDTKMHQHYPGYLMLWHVRKM